MFVADRGFLYTIPAGLILLWHWREKYFRASQDRQSGPLPFWVELSLYASMPLFHLHTFMTLSIVLMCLFVAVDSQIRGHFFMIMLCDMFSPAFFVCGIMYYLRVGLV